MIDTWQTIKIEELAAKDAVNSFVDGDWIESEHITNEGIRIIQTGNIGIGRYLDKADSRKYISESSFQQLKCKKVFPSDLLICRLADPIGRCCIVPDDEPFYVTAVDVVILRPSKQFSKEFLLYFLNDAKILKIAKDQAAGSTRQRISRTNYGRIQITLPSFSEQALVAEILSTADEAIAQTEALIAKYQRIKTGLMQDLLTRGIDANGNIRSKATHRFVVKNGIEVPEEWEVVRFGDYIGLVHGYQFRNFDFTIHGIPVVKIGEVKPDGVDLSGCSFVAEKRWNEFPKQQLKNGDVLMALTGATL